MDFKQKIFGADAPPAAKAELIKDILAFANTTRSTPAHILYGVAHENGRATVVGIPAARDDAEFQNLFHHRINRRPRFHYYEVEVDGNRVGIFSIPVLQPRPLFLTSEYEHVRDNVVYIRRGSSTVIASPDEWEHIMPRRERVRAVGPAPSGGDVEAVARRWWAIFENHGVLRHQIPTLLSQFSLPVSALADWRETADLLTNDLREATCELFNIRRAWLDGDDDRIYESICLDKRLATFLETLVPWRKQTEEVTLLAFRSGKKPLEVDYRQAGGLMLRAQLHEFGEKTVFKYAPIFGGLEDWGCPEQRRLGKLAVLAATKLECDSVGKVIHADAIETLSEGAVFPETIVTNPWRQEWHPDDFVHRPEESMAAQDPAELEAVYRRAEEIGLLAAIRDARTFLGLVGDFPPKLSERGEMLLRKLSDLPRRDEPR